VSALNIPLDFMIAMATAAARGLLERMDRLIRLRVAIISHKYTMDGDILRLVDLRRIPDAMEFIKLLYTLLHGVTPTADSDQQLTLSECVGVSY
jgi:hypothetical protein